MKLAEALLIRAQMQQKLQSLRGRILANLRVQEGETVQEEPQGLLEEFMTTSQALADLIKQINACNNRTKLESGQMMSEALADREALIRDQELLASVTSATQEPMFRVARAELAMRVTLSMPDVQKQADHLAQKRRELDVMIQSVNWTTEM